MNQKNYNRHARNVKYMEYGIDFDDANRNTVIEYICADFDEWKLLQNLWESGEDHLLFTEPDKLGLKFFVWSRDTLSSFNRYLIDKVEKEQEQRQGRSPITGHYRGGDRPRTNGMY